MSGICPLFLMAAKQKGELVTSNDKNGVECLKSACEWYVMHEIPPTEGCAVAKMADLMKYISTNLPG